MTSVRIDLDKFSVEDMFPLWDKGCREHNPDKYTRDFFKKKKSKPRHIASQSRFDDETLYGVGIWGRHLADWRRLESLSYRLWMYAQKRSELNVKMIFENWGRGKKEIFIYHKDFDSKDGLVFSGGRYVDDEVSYSYSRRSVKEFLKFSHHPTLPPQLSNTPEALKILRSISASARAWGNYHRIEAYFRYSVSCHIAAWLRSADRYDNLSPDEKKRSLALEKDSQINRNCMPVVIIENEGRVYGFRADKYPHPDHRELFGRDPVFATFNMK